MRKMSFRTRLWLLILLTALLIGLTTFAVGKYITTIPLPNKVTFTARLAEKVVLVESKITRKADGTYETTGETVTSGTQEYVLIPGLDVPKDPRVVITGKTSIPAYLYIEIVDTLDTVEVNGEDVKLISYDLTSNWKETTEKAKQHGGTVYVYTGGGGTPQQLTGTSQDMTINILVDDQVIVSQHIKHADITADGDTDILTFYAYLEEVVPTDP